MTTAERSTASSEQPTEDLRHPLDPLSAEEIRETARVLRASGRLTPRARFVSIALHEPSKEAVRAFRLGDPIQREAFAVVLDRDTGETGEAVVSLTDGALRSWTPRPGVQPQFLSEELEELYALLQRNEEWCAALRRRGVRDVAQVQIDPWSVGTFLEPAEQGRRMVRAISFAKEDPADNPYARPIQGVIALVDLTAMEVLRVIDEGEARLPASNGRYDVAAAAPRTTLRPLEITQPEGVSFELRGHELRWERWRIRVGMTPREGLVLHDIRYEDQGELRPVLYRASLAEMVVPYGDPSLGHYWQNAFDVGEYGIGQLSNSLLHGCDCLGEITYLDAVFHDGAGEPVVRPNAICIHEEDHGVLWRHRNRQRESDARRSRRLVVSSFATVGNYDYGFYWSFYQDGRIELETKFTGIVMTRALAAGEQPQTATRVEEDLAAPNHQHFLSFRLDLDIDGSANQVYEMSTAPLARGPENPHGNAFVSRARLLASEREAQCSVDPLSARYWKVVNPQRRNAWGQPTGYAFYPGETVAMMAAEDSSVAQRAAFARKQLWITRQAPGERYPAGDYPNQHPGGAGLPAWTAGDRPLDGEDLVLWYTMGINHIVRPEEWPVMPVHHAGFALKPWGFFDRNPALDVPPAPHACD